MLNKTFTLDLKTILLIALGALLSISIFLNVGSTKDNIKYIRKLEKYQDSIIRSNHKIELLTLDEMNLVSQLQVREKEIQNLQIVIKNQKKRTHEKVDSVGTLSNDNTTLYISNWLSKRGSTK